ncbi:hypothetical protein AB4427_14675 [Vibrio artabrorum]|uniref:hypothetical protein n=1 Tax=Vibrio artabrorum TaxID=446374 RepID=UPI00354EA764
MNKNEKSKLRQEFKLIESSRLTHQSKYKQYKDVILALRHHGVSYEKISHTLPFKSSPTGIFYFISHNKTKNHSLPESKGTRPLTNNPNQLSLILIKNEIEYLNSLNGCTINHIKLWLRHYKGVSCHTNTISKALRRWKKEGKNSLQNRRDK